MAKKDCPMCGLPLTLERRPQTKRTYQYRYKNAYGNWLVTRRLYTPSQAVAQFEGSTEYKIHAGPFEVEVEE